MHIRKFLKIEKSDLFNLHNKTRKKDRFSKQNCSKHTFISAINIQLKLLMHEKAKKYINFCFQIFFQAFVCKSKLRFCRVFSVTLYDLDTYLS